MLHSQCSLLNRAIGNYFKKRYPVQLIFCSVFGDWVSPELGIHCTSAEIKVRHKRRHKATLPIYSKFKLNKVHNGNCIKLY